MPADCVITALSTEQSLQASFPIFHGKDYLPAFPQFCLSVMLIFMLFVFLAVTLPVSLSPLVICFECLPHSKLWLILFVLIISWYFSKIWLLNQHVIYFTIGAIRDLYRKNFLMPLWDISHGIRSYVEILDFVLILRVEFFVGWETKIKFHSSTCSEWSSMTSTIYWTCCLFSSIFWLLFFCQKLGDYHSVVLHVAPQFYFINPCIGFQGKGARTQWYKGSKWNNNMGSVKRGDGREGKIEDGTWER